MSTTIEPLFNVTYEDKIATYKTTVDTYNQETYKEINEFIAEVNKKITEKRKELEDEANQKIAYDLLYPQLEKFSNNTEIENTLKTQINDYKALQVNGYTPEYEARLLKEVKNMKKNGKRYANLDEMWRDLNS